MHNHLFRPLYRLHGAANQVISSLGQYFNGDIVRNVIAFDQLADKVKVGLRG